MIGGKKENNESCEKTIIRKIREEMNIKIADVKFILATSSGDKDTYFYHGKLTDDNVNFIQRSEGQELQFFDLDELNSLQLAGSADMFFTENKNIIEGLLIN
jgi:ADP-ribose pyrophosphatase YjhB (NUDIX family)